MNQPAERSQIDPPFPRVHPLGDAALTVEWGERIDPDVHSKVLALAEAAGRLEIRGLVEMVPAYTSLTIHIDPLIGDLEELGARLLSLIPTVRRATSRAHRRIQVPIVYGGAYGPDLEEVATLTQLSTTNVIRLHSSTPYRVYQLGFSPGFPYMAQLPDQLAVPRLATPRTAVPAGSVGIAGIQTGIYPIASPGGWRLIGRTPLQPFCLDRTPCFLFEPGDEVTFVPIDEQAFERLQLSDDANG